MIEMTKMEKIVLGIIICCVLFISLIVGTKYNQIQDSGGIKQMVISAGKEIKDIANEIKKEN